MMSKCCLFIILITISISLANAATIKLNTASSCVKEKRECIYEDPSIWEGGIVPGIKDDVVILSSNPLVVVLASHSEYNSMTTNDNISLQEDKEGGKKKSWISENWPGVVFYSIMGALGIAAIKIISIFDNWKHIGDLHKSFSHYLPSLSVSKLGCWDTMIIFFGIFLGPMVAILSFSLVLAVLIPTGFIFGFIEHKSILLWTVLVIFIQMGGILDLVTDLALIATFFIDVIKIEFGEPVTNDGESEEDLEGPELKLFVARGIITVLAAVFIMFFFFSLINGTVGRLLDKMSGKQYFTDGKKQSSSSSYKSPLALIFAALLAAALWKVVLIALRLYLLFMIFRSLIKHGGMVELIERKCQWIEIILYLDLMLSGIPLGVVTFLELYISEKQFEFGEDNALEVVKLLALAVDLVSASFTFWFILVGLIHKIPLLHHSHSSSSHSSSSSSSHRDESRERLLGNNDEEDKKPNNNNVKKTITVNISVNQ